MALAKLHDMAKSIQTAKQLAKTNEDAIRQVDLYKQEIDKLKAMLESKEESKSDGEAERDKAQGNSEENQRG